MYLGGPEQGRVFLGTHLELATDEVRREADLHLPFFLRFRGAVQAAYFSVRIADCDLTGIVSEAGNREGLDDARRMLTG